MPNLDTNPLSRPLPVNLGAGRNYAYHFGSHSELPALMEAADLRAGRCLVVTDEYVGAQYGDELVRILERAGWSVRVVTLPAGESSKGYRCLHRVYDEALVWGIDRQTPLIALGGGVVGDLAGFAAASLLRGLPFIQLPTTLIAQVDSALGGKTGINHDAGKNLIGAFHQPEFVLADLETLSTLPRREWTSGLAEVVKHALIADPEFFELLEANWDAILARDAPIVGPVIYRAAQIKAEVVSQDEKEAGLRAILNFGHTFGHAIEHVAGYGHYAHGEAVALGMRAALDLSSTHHPGLDATRADALVARLPILAPPAAMPLDDLMQAMSRDKKVLSGRIRFVLLDRIGRAYVEEKASIDAARAAFERMLALSPVS